MCLFVGPVACVDLESIVVQAIVELLDLVRLHGIMILRQLAQFQWLGSHLELGSRMNLNDSLIYRGSRLRDPGDIYSRKY